MAKSSKTDALGNPALALRIAQALERLAPPALSTSLPGGDAFVWEPAQGGWCGAHVAHVDLKLLKGIENQRDTLLANTKRFAEGLRPTTRCCGRARHGKSSLVKAVHNRSMTGAKAKIAWC